MKSVKKFLKLLCFAFIAIFAVVLGGETVNAIDAPDNITVTRTFNNDSFNANPNWPFYVKHSNIGGHYYYVFCLDSSYNVNYNSINLDDDLYSSKREYVGRIVSKAYQIGLARAYDLNSYDGSLSHTVTIDGNNYTVSEKDLYGITQMAVWYAVHGNDYNGYTVDYKKWIEDDSSRTAIFNYLINIDDVADERNLDGSYFVNMIPNGNSSDFVDTDGGTTISSVGYRVSASNRIPNNTDFILRRTSNNDSNAKICVDGICSDSSDIAVHNGQVVTFKFDKPANNNTNLSSDFVIESVEFSIGYKSFFYNGGGNSNQNIGVVIPQSTRVDSSLSINTVYVDSTDVFVQKVNSNGTAIAGAKLGIYRKSDNFLIQTITSTDSSSGVSVTLPVGEYYLKEIEAPNGYKLSNEKAYFNIVKQGNVVSVENVDGNGSSIGNVAVITITNDKKKVRFKKVDSTGTRISNIRINIGDYVDEVLFHLQNSIFGCTVSDGDGYLVPCDVNSLPDGYIGEGWYEYPVDKILYFEEQQKEGFDNSSYSKGMHVAFFKDEVISLHPNIEVNEVNGDIEITIKNYMYIDISKTEVNKGNVEVPGARLAIYDAENLNYFGDSELGDNGSLIGLDQYVALDSWVSGNEPHRFIGVVPGHKYLLVEDLAPEGYIKLGSVIEFSMDEQGNVTVHNNTDFEDKDINKGKYKLGISNDYTKVSISKTDFTTSEELEGATLKICTKDAYDLKGNDCDTIPEWQWVSGTEAHQIDRLPVGEYYLVETIAPAGYYKATNAVKFEVSDAEVLPVVFENKPTKVVIKKLDNVTKEMIEGAQFKILKASDRSEVLDKDGKPLEWTSTKDEPWVIYALPAGEYILVETKVPEGYQEGMIVNGEVVNEYKFTVSDDVENIDVEVYIEVLNAPSTGVSTLNLFAIGALLIFTGYETIKIYRRKVNA